MKPGRANIEKIMLLDSLDMDPSDVSALEEFVPVVWDGKRRSRLSAYVCVVLPVPLKSCFRLLAVEFVR